jgi:hypothetical protein
MECALDVHPPHEPIHSWKDFFIHLITITIGLFIALSLEQTVEWVHHRHQVAETREALRIELQQNRDRFALETAEFYRQNAALGKNLSVFLYLQQHPGAPQEKLPSAVTWEAFGAAYYDSAWKTAEQTSVTALMPQEEVRSASRQYVYLERIRAAHLDARQAIYEAKRYAYRDPELSHLSPAQIASQIDLTETVIMRQAIQGELMRNFSSQYPEFTPAPTTAALAALEHDPDIQRTSRLVEMFLRTTREINAGQAPEAIRSVPGEK